MWLPSSIRRLVLFALPMLLSTGCHAWRFEQPLPERETFLDLGTPIAPMRELVEVNDLVSGCYDRLRSVTRSSWRTHSNHRKVGMVVAALANSIGAMATATPMGRNERALDFQRIALGVSVTALALTTVDLLIHPSVKAARSRSSNAQNEWAALSLSMNRWESSAQSWSVASANGDTTAASASRSLWRAEDGQLRERAFVCATQDVSR